MTKGKRTEQFLHEVIPLLVFFVIVGIIVCAGTVGYVNRIDEIDRDRTSDYCRSQPEQCYMPDVSPQRPMPEE